MLYQIFTLILGTSGWPRSEISRCWIIKIKHIKRLCNWVFPSQDMLVACNCMSDNPILSEPHSHRNSNKWDITLNQFFKQYFFLCISRSFHRRMKIKIVLECIDKALIRHPTSLHINASCDGPRSHNPFKIDWVVQ